MNEYAHEDRINLKGRGRRLAHTPPKPYKLRTVPAWLWMVITLIIALATVGYMVGV